MSKLEVVPLDGWKLPTQRPTVLLVQPRTLYEKRADKQVRPQPQPEYIDKLFAALEAAITQQAHITVFPEYAWPIAQAARLRGWLETTLPEGYACVLPFEHLLLSELSPLLQHMSVDEQEQRQFLEEMKAARGAIPPEGGYCNVLLLAVKASGALRLIPQAKLYPAHFEELSRGSARQFIPGQRLRLLQGQNISVATTICFDFIARDEAVDERPRELLVKEHVDLFIVPECNPAPLHHAYARGLVALYSSPAWARQPPVVLFTNVAQGSRLAGIDEKQSFGFSRVFGRLGTLGPPAHPFFRDFEGVVTSKARSLDELADNPPGLPIPTLRLLTIRPQESAVCLTLPSLRSGPSRDPETTRTSTQVTPLRYVSTEKRWQRIHHTTRPTPSRDPQGIPPGLLQQARSSVHPQAEADFERRLRQAAGPLWVQGQGGSGKTTLVARVLQDKFVVRGLARVVWLDLSRSRGTGSVDELQAALLLALGKPRALKRKPEEQWQVIVDELSRKPTLLVLDSFERWSGGGALLPDELRRMAWWPGRLVVTVRGGAPEADEVCTLGLLEPDPAYAFLQHEAGRPVDRKLSDALHQARGGLPLALSWVGGMLREGLSAAEIEEGLRTAGTEEGLEKLFKHSTASLPLAASSILGVLALLPARVAHAELVEILGLPPGKVDEALEALTSRNLILREPDPDGEGIYGRHPFVSQFMRSDALQNTRLQQQVVAWALKILETHGGDRHWQGYPLLWRLWPNLRSVLDLLANSASPDDQRRFLQGWRKADYPLWSGALWRDRAALGRKVLEVAPRLGGTAALEEAHAAYDSVAETEWHLNHDAAAVWPLFDRAETLLKTPGHDRELALVDYYRARVHRDLKNLDTAQQLLSRVERTAEALQDEHLRALALNQRGKIANTAGKPDEARAYFAQARQRFERQDDPRLHDPEMVAVVDRNEGKVELDQEVFGKALDLFERSMHRFQDLQLQVEEAETANLHAQALARLGEFEEAELEYHWARSIMEELGAGVRHVEFTTTAQLLARKPRG